MPSPPHVFPESAYAWWYLFPVCALCFRDKHDTEQRHFVAA